MINNVDNGKEDSYNEFMSKKLKRSNCKHNVFSKRKNEIVFFAVVVTKPVDIVFEKTIDKIKDLIQNYVTP